MKHPWYVQTTGADFRSTVIVSANCVVSIVQLTGKTDRRDDPMAVVIAEGYADKARAILDQVRT